MYLINTRSLELEEFEGQDIPSYAILSHRWGKEEVLFKHMIAGNATKRGGFEKIRRFCLEAETFGVDYAWVDTCCIDKSSSADLSEAINSMFKWYQNCFICLVHLCDVDSSSSDQGQAALVNSVWFTRGWTLQELIAPRTIEFYDSEWRSMGDMDALRDVISETTSIPLSVLIHSRPLHRFPIAQRMSWATERQTTRIEDRAYSLMGIFDIHMPMLYGEGENAFRRLQEEIVKRHNDTSILFWAGEPLAAFARSPSAFAVFRQLHNEILREGKPGNHSGCSRPLDGHSLSHTEFNTESSAVTNIGLSISIPLFPWYFDMSLGLVAIIDLKHYSSWYCFVYLTQSLHHSRLIRASWKGEDVKCIPQVMFQNLYRSYNFHELSSHTKRIVIASEHNPVPTVEFPGQYPPGSVIFNFEKNAIWGQSGVPHASDIITRTTWDANKPTLHPIEPCQLLAVFQIARTSGEKAYLYMGYDEDFDLCIALAAWDWPYCAYGPFNHISALGPHEPILSNLLQPITFWSWLKDAAHQGIERTIKAHHKNLASLSAPILDDCGLWVTIEYSPIRLYTVSFFHRNSNTEAGPLEADLSAAMTLQDSCSQSTTGSVQRPRDHV